MPDHLATLLMCLALAKRVVGICKGLIDLLYVCEYACAWLEVGLQHVNSGRLRINGKLFLEHEARETTLLSTRETHGTHRPEQATFPPHTRSFNCHTLEQLSKFKPPEQPEHSYLEDSCLALPHCFAPLSLGDNVAAPVPEQHVCTLMLRSCFPFSDITGNKIACTASCHDPYILEAPTNSSGKVRLAPLPGLRLMDLNQRS